MLKIAYGAAGIALASLLAGSANAQLMAHKDISLAMAVTMAKTAIENSMKKAYTARTFRRPSGEFAAGVKGNPTAGALMLNNIVAAQGALPIKVGDDTIGAIGVSGAPGGEKDEACAKAGIDKVSADLK
jgi:uncharacterized protein GlcG (DUF336 family)